MKFLIIALFLLANAKQTRGPEETEIESNSEKTPLDLSKQLSATSESIDQYDCSQNFLIQNKANKTYLKWSGSASRFIVSTSNKHDAIKFQFCANPCGETSGWHKSYDNKLKSKGRYYLRANDPANPNYYYWLTYGKAAGTDKNYLMSIFDNNCSMSWENYPVPIAHVHLTPAAGAEPASVRLVIRSYTLWLYWWRYGFNYLKYYGDYAYFGYGCSQWGTPSYHGCYEAGDEWSFLSTKFEDVTETLIKEQNPPFAKCWSKFCSFGQKS